MSDTEAALWTPPRGTKTLEPDILESLRAVPLFADLGERELKRLLRMLHERTYEAGEVIFREGEPGHGMYIVKRGEVRILIRLPGGGERQVATLTDRQFFGEMALLEDAPRSATSIASQRTELLGFFLPDLEGLLERDTRLGSKVLWQLARLMASRLRATNETLKAQRAASPDKR